MPTTKLSDAELNRWIANEVMKFRYTECSIYGEEGWSEDVQEGLVALYGPYDIDFTEDLNLAVKALRKAMELLEPERRKKFINCEIEGDEVCEIVYQTSWQWILMRSKKPAREICEAIYEAMEGGEDDTT